jgi:hypothetical protein
MPNQKRLASTNSSTTKVEVQLNSLDHLIVTEVLRLIRLPNSMPGGRSSDFLTRSNLKDIG